MSLENWLFWLVDIAQRSTYHFLKIIIQIDLNTLTTFIVTVWISTFKLVLFVTTNNKLLGNTLISTQDSDFHKTLIKT